MSKANNKAILQLYILAGCFNTLYQQNAFARVDIREELKRGRDISLDAIERWPGRDDITARDRDWIVSRRDAWRKFIDDDPTEGYSAATLIKTTVYISTALSDVLKNRFKKSFVDKIVEIAFKLDNFNDPDDRNFLASEEAYKLSGEMYKLIGMEAYA